MQNWGCMGSYPLLQTLKQLVLGHLTFMANHCVVRERYFISLTSCLISQHLVNNGFGSRRYSLNVCGFLEQTMWQEAKRTLWVLAHEWPFAVWKCHNCLNGLRLSLEKVLTFVLLSPCGWHHWDKGRLIFLSVLMALNALFQLCLFLVTSSDVCLP